MVPAPGRTACALALALCLWPRVEIAARQRVPQPVLIGGAESSEGCAGTATVTVREGSTLNLRSGPGTGYAVVARLPPGQTVSICQSPGNGWVGVVVHRRGRVSDCGLSDAGLRAKPYAGPCDSGWVKEEFLRLLAG
jgi:hypothetical protein